MGVKDIIETTDMPTEMGSPLFEGWRSGRDAATVVALRKAGAVVLGKTVTTEFAATEPRGTRNPWDLARTPGGSSSGSAAAVAAGLVSAALGTQVVGSIVRPASYCGCVGFKPSVGAINRGGSHDYLSQSCTGVLAATLDDAWRVALVAVASGADFSERARSLGQASAEVHASLAQAMGTRGATDDDVVALTRSMQARHAAAVSEVPALAEFDPMVKASIEAVSSATWPALQRIHGDYHLGQVLDVPDRGWVLVDFEGEPLRPLADRTRPDLALRDVAGMLRSFDYVAGSWEQAHPGGSASSWATRARTAFLEGYAQSAGRDPRQDAELLNALELDKALYEVVYEARNRPTWLSIPTTAIARLSAGPRSDLRL